MNPDAQPLTLAEAAEIKRDPVCSGRVLVSYRLMLDFYGVQLDDEATGAVSRTPHYAERFAHLNFSFHNYLRITRILKCLGELGFEHFKVQKRHADDGNRPLTLPPYIAAFDANAFPACALVPDNFHPFA